jgi:hypothetical protein
MSLGFPTANLVTNSTTYTVNTKTWIWDGYGWQLQTNTYTADYGLIDGTVTTVNDYGSI